VPVAAPVADPEGSQKAPAALLAFAAGAEQAIGSSSLVQYTLLGSFVLGV